MNTDPLHLALCAAVGVDPEDVDPDKREKRRRPEPLALNSDALAHALASAVGAPIEGDPQ